MLALVDSLWSLVLWLLFSVPSFGLWLVWGNFVVGFCLDTEWFAVPLSLLWFDVI